MNKQLVKPEKPARLQIIACGALARELLVLIDQLPNGAVALTCLPASWHNHPEKIVPGLKQKIAAAHRSGMDISVAYGDCGPGGALDHLLDAEKDGEYSEVIEINLNDIKEPILACPNDPDDVRLLSSVAKTSIDEVFIGSCMTNIGHFRAAAQLLKDKSELNTVLWVVPPTRMDEKQLRAEGIYETFERLTDRTEVPGCSLCMGNQARVEEGASVVSTSTRNFPNRLGDNSNVFLASAEVAAISAKLGYIPTSEEYLSLMKDIEPLSGEIYQYLNFDQIADYQESSSNVPLEMILQS